MATDEEERLIDRALGFVADEKWEEARIALEDLLEKAPDLGHGYGVLGLAYWYLDRFEEAERTLRKAIQFDPNDAIAVQTLGFTLTSLYRLSEAEEAFRRSIRIDSDDYMNWLGLAGVLSETDRHEEAEDILLRAAGMKPDSFWVWFDLGRVYHALGKMEEAIDSLHRARSINQDTPGPLRSLGEVYLDIDEPARAKEHFQKAIELDSDYVHALRDLGKAHLVLEEYTEAEDVAKNLLNRQASDCTAWGILGMAQLRTDRLPDAERSFDEALKECRNLEVAHRGLLEIYEKEGRVEESEQKRERIRRSFEGVYVTEEMFEGIMDSVDPSIRDIIAELNALGLDTSSSCSGLLEDHPDTEPQNPYVVFIVDYPSSNYHLFTIAHMAHWNVDYGPNGYGVEMRLEGYHCAECIRERWNRLIQMARLVMRELKIFREAVEEYTWEEED